MGGIANEKMGRIETPNRVSPNPIETSMFNVTMKGTMHDT